MKTAVLNSFIKESGIAALFTAIRRDEHVSRAEETPLSNRTDPAHIRVHPILHFTERDVWETTHRYSIPYCQLYKKGYRSLGTRSGTQRFSDLPAWEQDLENTSERGGRDQEKESIMEQLRSLGYM
jgi:phosphoadenosine phosphosulfate reductase